MSLTKEFLNRPTNISAKVAEKWKDEIDIRAYNALMKYEVVITD